MIIKHIYNRARVVEQLSATNIPGTSATYNIIGSKMALGSSNSSYLKLQTNANGIVNYEGYIGTGVNLNDMIDTSRSASYWITTGWKIVSVNANTSKTNAQDLTSSTVLMATDFPTLLTAAGGVYPYWVEYCYNPITRVLELRVNGTLVNTVTVSTTVATNISNNGLYIVTDNRVGTGGTTYSVTFDDVYSAIFESTEQYYLRRWKTSHLVPATNNFGANTTVADLTRSSVGATVLTNQYTVPSSVAAVVAEASGISTSNLSNLHSVMTIGSQTLDSLITTFNSTQTATLASPGNGVNIGTLPSPPAGTLSLSLNAVLK